MMYAPGAVIPSRPLAECWKKRFVVSDESVSFLAIAWSAGNIRTVSAANPPARSASRYVKRVFCCALCAVSCGVMVRSSFGAGFCAASGAAAANDIDSARAAFTLRRRPVGPTVAATRRGMRFRWLMPAAKCRFRARAQPGGRSGGREHLVHPGSGAGDDRLGVPLGQPSVIEDEPD